MMSPEILLWIYLAMGAAWVVYYTCSSVVGHTEIDGAVFWFGIVASPLIWLIVAGVTLGELVGTPQAESDKSREDHKVGEPPA